MLNTSNIELTYTINSGQRYIIDKIKTNVDPVFDKKYSFLYKKVIEKLQVIIIHPLRLKNY